MLLDIRSRLTGNIIASAVSEDAALAWLTSQGTEQTTAHDCLVILAADKDGHLNAGDIIVTHTTEAPVLTLQHKPTAEKRIDHDAALTHYCGLLARVQAGHRARRPDCA